MLFRSIYILFLGYFGLRQSHVFLSSAPRTPVTTGTGRQKTTSPGMVSPEHSSFISTLLRHMETEQPHLDPELTLAKLSASLRVKPEYLSQVLNDALQQNFFDFINRYRIEEFKHLRNRTSHQHLSILGLAYECGFNSKAAFYRAFKRYAGMSPTTWVENVSS